uniref:RCC1 domain containing 1 n=1 Tax=Periophthalmus magnuspinnatus TaxID=409849 RepID=A0A3B4AI14_9GOBI
DGEIRREQQQEEEEGGGGLAVSCMNSKSKPRGVKADCSFFCSNQSKRRRTESCSFRKLPKLECPKAKGQLLIFGATNWDLIGRKEVPKQQAAFRNLGQNLWGPHRYGCLNDIQVSCVVSGPCAAFSLLITAEGKLWSWGESKGSIRWLYLQHVCRHTHIKIHTQRSLDPVISSPCHCVCVCPQLVLDSQKRVFSWGFGGYGRLGHTEQKDEMVPRLVKLFDFPGRGASLIYTGYQCSFAVNEMGKRCPALVLSLWYMPYLMSLGFTGGLFFWGVTNTSRECTMYPKMVQDLCGWKIRSLACG